MNTGDRKRSYTVLYFVNVLSVVQNQIFVVSQLMFNIHSIYASVCLFLPVWSTVCLIEMQFLSRGQEPPLLAGTEGGSVEQQPRIITQVSQHGLENALLIVRTCASRWENLK